MVVLQDAVPPVVAHLPQLKRDPNQTVAFLVNMKKSYKNIIKLTAFIVLILLAFLLSRYFELGSRLSDLHKWIDTLGPLAPIAYLIVYVGATILAIPGTVLTLAAGALFGSFFGVILVSISSTLGAAVCFLIARYAARDAAANRLASKPSFQKLDELTESQGAIIVALTRLVPIFPYNLLNYGFGLTKVPFRTYVFWSWLCMLPATIVYVVSIDAITTALTEKRMPWALIFAVAIAATILVLLIRNARQRLRAQSAVPNINDVENNSGP